MMCESNVCVPIPGYCDEDTDCADNMACGSDNQCFDPCSLVQCENPWQTCEVTNHNTACVGDEPVDPCDGVTCDAGQMCSQGSCIDDPAMMTISGYKYNDLNSNGALDDGEVGVAGYEIRIYNGPTLVGTASTDSTGFYSISVPMLAHPTPVNHYDIVEVIQADWTPVFPQVSYDPQYAGFCLYGITTDTTADFFNHFDGVVPPVCDPACDEGFTCVEGQCVENPPLVSIRPVVTDTHASKDSVLLRVIPTRIVMLEKCVLMAHANLHFVKLTLTASSLTTARGDASMDSAEIRLRLT